MNGAAPITTYYVRACACAWLCCMCAAKKESTMRAAMRCAAIACQLLLHLTLYICICVCVCAGAAILFYFQFLLILLRYLYNWFCIGTITIANNFCCVLLATVARLYYVITVNSRFDKSLKDKHTVASQ